MLRRQLHTLNGETRHKCTSARLDSFLVSTVRISRGLMEHQAPRGCQCGDAHDASTLSPLSVL